MKTSSIDFEISFYEGIIKGSPNYIDALILLAEAYTRKGLYAKGLQADQRLAELCQKDSIVYYNLACSYALVGEKAASLKTLRQAIQLGYRDFAHLRKDPDLKCLHEEADFKSLLKSLIKTNRD